MYIRIFTYPFKVSLFPYKSGREKESQINHTEDTFKSKTRGVSNPLPQTASEKVEDIRGTTHAVISHSGKQTTKCGGVRTNSLEHKRSFFSAFTGSEYTADKTDKSLTRVARFDYQTPLLPLAGRTMYCIHW